MRPLTAIISAALVLSACGTDRRVASLTSKSASADISLSSDVTPPVAASHEVILRDTALYTEGQPQTLIMNAVKDESGEMVATDVIQAAKVTARFRNVAERHGKVDLRFDVTVPSQMQDSKWQIRLYPTMYLLSDTVNLDQVIVTGKEYRKAQLRGYQQYEKFLRSLLSDPDAFVDTWQLEVFLRRNIPSIYAFRNDTTYVSEEEFFSGYGVSERDALEHYTNKLLLKYNDYRKSLTDRKYRRYVKSPFPNEGLRLDTVLQTDGGDFIYQYVQTITARPCLKKAEIVLGGEIYEQDKNIYTLPVSGPLTFYISSLSAFADASERYLTHVIERNVSANTACYIDFQQGSCEIDRHMSANDEELSRIEGNITALLCNESMVMDSIIVTASASPEGSYSSNTRLSERRSEAVSGYISEHIRHVTDSVETARGIVYDTEGRRIHADADRQKVSFISRSNSENWAMLDAIVSSDDSLSLDEKADYMTLALMSDLDARENMMQGRPWYRYVRSSLYPRLRTVRFDFHLHRRGMLKDTLHTTIIDSVYMRGVNALRDMDYERAVTLLRPYHDFNTAVAYCAMDYNASAMDILLSLDRSPKVNYMLALTYSRLGEDSKAADCYMTACSQDASLVHRGNLDPEISSIVRKYSLDTGQFVQY